MSGKAKRRDDDGASDTDSNSEGHVSPKKSLKKDYDDDPDSITICEVVRCPASVPGRASSIKTISNNKRVSVRKWKGNIMVDIHEFYIKDGKQLAGRKEQDSCIKFKNFKNSYSLIKLSIS
ncbi:hypothetical protein AAZX31_19G084300 [Glycine max]